MKRSTPSEIMAWGMNGKPEARVVGGPKRGGPAAAASEPASSKEDPDEEPDEVDEPEEEPPLDDEIRVTAAGTAAGTSVDLAKLGAEVIAMGAIGDDLLADFLTMVLDRHGVATHLLARKSGVQTSATMLPIRPNGERPALHTPGATPTLTEADIDLAAIETADVLHIGGPDVLGRFGGAELCRVLEFARGAGVTTTMDVLSTGDATPARTFMANGLFRTHLALLELRAAIAGLVP